MTNAEILAVLVGIAFVAILVGIIRFVVREWNDDNRRPLI